MSSTNFKLCNRLPKFPLFFQILCFTLACDHKDPGAGHKPQEPADFQVTAAGKQNHWVYVRAGVLMCTDRAGFQGSIFEASRLHGTKKLRGKKSNQTSVKESRCIALMKPYKLVHHTDWSPEVCYHKYSQ